jgi:hypothetical protein
MGLKKSLHRYRNESTNNRCNLANRNEDNKLELPGTWESLNSSEALQISEAKETHYGFLDGNQVEKRKNGGNPM